MFLPVVNTGVQFLCDLFACNSLKVNLNIALHMPFPLDLCKAYDLHSCLASIRCNAILKNILNYNLNIILKFNNVKCYIYHTSILHTCKLINRNSEWLENMAKHKLRNLLSEKHFAFCLGPLLYMAIC